METNRIFLWITRLNAVLFLLLLLAALGITAFAFLESRDWAERRAVEVVKDEKKALPKEKLTLGSINRLCGQDVKYVELHTEHGGKSYSSGGGSSQIRNVIFFSGDSRAAHWLFESNHYLINNVRSIPYSYSDCGNKKVSVIYYDTVMQDSNHDGKLSDEDEHTIAITDPYGRNYRVLVAGATKVLDYELTAEGQQISLLLQLDKQIVMRDYSLKGELLAESPITELSGR